MNQPNNQLFTAISYSYGEYINAELELLTNSLFFSIPYFDEETYNIQNGLKEIFLDLPTLLSPNTSQKEACATKLLSYRECLEKKYRHLIAYQRELTHLLALKQNSPTATEDYLAQWNMTEADAHTINYSELAKDCSQFVFKEPKIEVRQQRASSLLPYVPIKITRENFLAYTKNSITHIAMEDHEESTMHLVSILKQLFDGQDAPEYGKHFSDLKESLEALYEIDNLEDLFEEANLLNETIETLINLLNSMFKIICSLSNLLLFDELEFTDLTTFHASFSDFYYSLKALYNTDEESEIILSTLKERVQDVLNELKKQFQTASVKGQTNPHFNLIQAYLSMSLEDMFSFSIAKQVHYSPKVLDVLNDFIDFLREKLASLPTDERKCRMQYLISNIPFVMSHSNFETYVAKAFTHMKAPSSGLLVAMQLNSILEQSGYFGETNLSPVLEQDFEEDDEAARFIASCNPIKQSSASEDDFYQNLFSGLDKE